MNHWLEAAKNLEPTFLPDDQLESRARLYFSGLKDGDNWARRIANNILRVRKKERKALASAAKLSSSSVEQNFTKSSSSSPRNLKCKVEEEESSLASPSVVAASSNQQKEPIVEPKKSRTIEQIPSSGGSPQAFSASGILVVPSSSSAYLCYSAISVPPTSEGLPDGATNPSLVEQCNQQNLSLAVTPDVRKVPGSDISTGQASGGCFSNNDSNPMHQEMEEHQRGYENSAQAMAPKPSMEKQLPVSKTKHCPVKWKLSEPVLQNSGSTHFQLTKTKQVSQKSGAAHQTTKGHSHRKGSGHQGMLPSATPHQCSITKSNSKVPQTPNHAPSTPSAVSPRSPANTATVATMLPECGLSVHESKTVVGKRRSQVSESGESSDGCSPKKKKQVQVDRNCPLPSAEPSSGFPKNWHIPKKSSTKPSSTVNSRQSACSVGIFRRSSKDEAFRAKFIRMALSMGNRSEKKGTILLDKLPNSSRPRLEKAKGVKGRKANYVKETILWNK